MLKPPSDQLKIAPVSFSGPETLIVGGQHFGLPVGSIVNLTRESRGRFAWVLLPDGTVHAVVAKGEVAVSDELQGAVRRQVFRQ